MSYNKQSLLATDSTDYEQQTPVAAGESRPNFNDDTKYRTVSVTKDNNHLGFDVKVNHLMHAPLWTLSIHRAVFEVFTYLTLRQERLLPVKNCYKLVV